MILTFVIRCHSDKATHTPDETWSDSLSPEALSFLNLQISRHFALAGKAKPAIALMRRESQSPLLHPGKRLLKPANLYGASAAGAKPFAVEPTRLAVMRRKAMIKQSAAQILAMSYSDCLPIKLDLVLGIGSGFFHN